MKNQKYFKEKGNVFSRLVKLEGDHSIFTYYLLKGLKGDQDSVDVYGNVTPDSLGKYVYREIVNLPIEKKPKQKPITKTEVAGDIILARYPELARPGTQPKDQVSIMTEEANNYYSRGKYDAAVECYDRVLKLDPDNVIAWNSTHIDVDYGIFIGTNGS